ncbi:hypothetical protein GCM10027037_03480 [Mucilaginibacter koreensis]
MNTPRFNVFNQIHKGLRALLFDTVMQLQQTDLTNIEKSAPAIAQVELLLDLFDAHAYHEDSCILNAAEQHAPAVIKSFESEHETDLELARQLRATVAAYKVATDTFSAGNNIYYALNDFVAFNLKHMNKEEQLLNSVLWQHYTDAEILDMERNIQQCIEPQKMNVYFEWMIKGMNDVELRMWLTAVKSEAPDFVLAGLLQACAHHLPEHRWLALEQQISEGAAIA